MHKIITFLTAVTLAGSALLSPSFALAASSHNSYNWAGYVANQGNKYTGVTATWVIPTVYNDNKGATDVTWVGVGGANTDDIIQGGTQAIVNATGPVTYTAWYELLPSSTVTVPLAIHAGDSITITIEETSSNKWNIFFENHTTGQNYEKNVNYVSSHSSAEWIQEFPTTTVGGKTLGFDDFGSVTFTEAYALRNGKEVSPLQLNAKPLILINEINLQVLASTGALSSSGDSFKVTRSPVSHPAPVPTPTPTPTPTPNPTPVPPPTTIPTPTPGTVYTTGTITYYGSGNTVPPPYQQTIPSGTTSTGGGIRYY